MASINALSTLALSGYSLPEWVGYLIFAFMLVFALFAFPRIIKFTSSFADYNGIHYIGFTAKCQQ